LVFSSLRNYLAAASTRERAKAILPSLLVLAVGAAILLLGSIGDIAGNRMLLRQTQADAIRGQFAFRLLESQRTLHHVGGVFLHTKELTESYHAGHMADFTHAAKTFFDQFHDHYEISHLEVFDSALNPVYGTAAPSEATKKILRQLEHQRGGITRLIIEPDGSYGLTLAFPWLDGGSGFVIITQALDMVVSDFERDTQLTVLSLPAPGTGGQDTALAPAVREKLRLPATLPIGRIAAALAKADMSTSPSTTMDIGGRPFDLIALALPPGVDSAGTRLASIQEAGARESLLMRGLLRIVLIWFVCVASFLGACLWLILRLSQSFEKRAHADLREREQRVNAVMDAVVDGIVTIDAAGLILSFNPAAEIIFGMPARETIGQNVNILMPSGMTTQHQGYIDRYLTTGQRHVIGVKREVMGRRKDGTEFPMDIAISQSSVGGNIIFIGVMRDVTDRKMANDLLLETLRQQKAAQQALRRRSDELVRAAKALTVARDKAEAANEAKSRFLASMSHELRTPLNGVLGMVELLLRSSLTSEQEKWARMVRESGQTLLTLLNDILDLSKIEAGRFEIRPAPFDPGALAHQVVFAWEHQAKEKGLQLTCDVPPGTVLIQSDALRIRQILINYISNALKFTDRGFITLKMMASTLPGQRLRVRYEVSDTGSGIAEEDVPRLFEKFPDVDIETARQHNGAGLGLTICREIAGLMGATVGVESVLGAGSVFWLELICERTEIANPAHAPAPAAPQEQSSRPLRVLVAEDHPVNQKLFQALLGHLGHEILLVENGQAAVEAAAREHFDVALIDANMPVMDGAEAARRIRALGGERGRLPIIAVTAEAMVGDRERFLALGMDDYLAKPIDAQALAAIIERHGRSREAPAAARQAS
jgi:PAS domain S-box-containing protein